MKQGRLTTIATGFALGALTLGLGVMASLAPASTSAAAVVHAGSEAAGSRYVVLNCADKAQVRPGTIVLACADNGIGLQRLHWTSWTPELASAYGTEWQNDCKANCAEGHIHYFPAVIELWGSATVKGHPGERRYTEATISYLKARPAVYVMNCGKVVATHPVSSTVALAP